MEDKMYLNAAAQGEVSGRGDRTEEKLGGRLQRIGRDFGFFGVLSIFYGVSASFCLFRNPQASVHSEHKTLGAGQLPSTFSFCLYWWRGC